MPVMQGECHLEQTWCLQWPIWGFDFVEGYGDLWLVMCTAWPKAGSQPRLSPKKLSLTRPPWWPARACGSGSRCGKP